MFSWKFARFVIIGFFILGSGILVVRSPGWNAALAQVGYYIKYGASTTLWLDNNAWRNSERSFPVYANVSVNSLTAAIFCPDRRVGNWDYRTPGPYLDINCSPSGSTTLWLINNRWSNGVKTFSPPATEHNVVDAAAKDFCKSHNQTVAAKTLRKPGPHIDVICYKKVP
jgi:hypothetical protein